MAASTPTTTGGYLSKRGFATLVIDAREKSRGSGNEWIAFFSPALATLDRSPGHLDFEPAIGEKQGEGL